MENQVIQANEARESFNRAALRNRKLFEAAANRWVSLHAKKFKKECGYDPLPELAKEGFSLAAVHKILRERKLREEVTASQLYGLTTGLITQNMANEYKLVPTVYRNVANIKPSTKSEESYFPLQRTDVPTALEDNESPPTSGIGGVNTRIKNYRFARIVEYSATLEEDDQTGQVSDSATQQGQNMVYAEELWWATQLIGNYVAGKIRTSGGIIPDACVAGQGGNDPNYGGPTCTAGAPTRDGIANLYTAADYITDLEGNLGLVSVDTGVFANADKITVKTILTSDFNPATPSGSAGVTPGIFAENPLKDIFVMQFTRFFKYFAGSPALSGSGNPWFLGEAGKIGAFQDRTALEVTMESPLAGKSWENNLRRTKAERRFGAGVTLPEFALRGN
jgi:hypothetical protein